MPYDVPYAAFTEDSVEPLAGAVWLSKAIVSKELAASYREQKQAVLDVGLRVASGIHEMVVGRIVIGDSTDNQIAIAELANALGVRMPYNGPQSNPFLAALLAKLIEYLLKNLLDEEAAADA